MGTINTQIFIKAEQEEGYPATVKIEEQGISLVVHISLKASWGKATSPDLCSFYDEFGKNVKQASIRGQIKQSTQSSQKLPEIKKESSVPSESPTPPLSLTPPQVETPVMSPPSFPQGKVLWVYVNLREGPGTQYKIIGRAFMKNSFEILAEHTSWLRVRLENGTEGWMSKKASSESSKATSSQIPPDSFHDSPKTEFSSRPPCPM